MTRTVVESKTKTAVIGFDEPFCVIGERINPTGRKILAAELEQGDFSRVEADALAQVAAGANILDINSGAVFSNKMAYNPMALVMNRLAAWTVAFVALGLSFFTTPGELWLDGEVHVTKQNGTPTCSHEGVPL